MLLFVLQMICSHSSANFEDIDKSTFLHTVVDIHLDVEDDELNCTPPKFELITAWMETMKIGAQIDDIMTYICHVCDIEDEINDSRKRPMNPEMLSMHMKEKHNMERCQFCLQRRVSIFTTHTIYWQLPTFLMTTLCNNTLCNI